MKPSTAASWSIWRLVLLVVTGCALIQCAEPVQVEPEAQAIAGDTSCALDGMLLAVHHGPKSQVQRADGTRGFYCDTREVFGELLDPVRRRRVVGIWFQSLDQHPWAAHADGWAPADSILFVVGSTRMGAMGPTLAPFTSMSAARSFITEYRGTIHRFEEIGRPLLEQLQHQGMSSLR